MRIIMRTSEVDKPGKEAKESKTPNTDEQSPSTPPATGNPDWPGFQAYSPMPPHGFMTSSPQAPHPYMWGVQPMVPPYGTPPPPYMAMYPHGGVYSHPPMPPPGSYPFSPFAMSSPNGEAEASENTPSSRGADDKVADGKKKKLVIKRAKGSLGSSDMVSGKNNVGHKASGVSANGGQSKSADTLSGDSSDGSDANSGNDSPMKSGGGQDSLEAEASQSGGSAHGPRNGGPSTQVSNQSTTILPMAVTGVPSPTTNLNIGMDYWGGATPAALPAGRRNKSPAPITGGMVTAGSRERLNSPLWQQDERELKKQRRKQSNRESARRSRQRKQMECDELAQRTEVLRDENSNLRSELNRIRTEYEQLRAKNSSLKERLGEVPEHDT